MEMELVQMPASRCYLTTVVAASLVVLCFAGCATETTMPNGLTEKQTVSRAEFEALKQQVQKLQAHKVQLREVQPEIRTTPAAGQTERSKRTGNIDFVSALRRIDRDPSITDKQNIYAAIVAEAGLTGTIEPDVNKLNEFYQMQATDDERIKLKNAANKHVRESASSVSRFWPPPPASAYEVLPRQLLTRGNEKMTLEDVSTEIGNALSHCGYVERSFYDDVPNGFAIASRIEHINSDGSFAADRWAIETL